MWRGRREGVKFSIGVVGGLCGSIKEDMDFFLSLVTSLEWTGGGMEETKRKR